MRDNDTAMVCHQGGPRGALDRWLERPEDTLAGVSYRHGCGWWDGPRQTAGYIVQEGAPRNKGVREPGGMVFSAGCTDWAQVLGSGQGARIDTITRNVLDGLLNGSTH